jgi:hypothetical protein
LPDRPRLRDYAVGEDGTVVLWISYTALARFQVDDKKQAREMELDALHCLDSTDPDINLFSDE